MALRTNGVGWLGVWVLALGVIGCGGGTGKASQLELAEAVALAVNQGDESAISSFFPSESDLKHNYLCVETEHWEALKNDVADAEKRFRRDYFGEASVRVDFGFQGLDTVNVETIDVGHRHESGGCEVVEPITVVGGRVRSGGTLAGVAMEQAHDITMVRLGKSYFLMSYDSSEALAAAGEAVLEEPETAEAGNVLPPPSVGGPAMGASEVVPATDSDADRGIYPLGLFTVNLRGVGGGRVLRIEVDLELKLSALDTMEDKKAGLRDTVIMLVSDYSISDVEGLDGKLRLQDDLLVVLNKYMGNRAQIERVYFPHFVLQ